MAERLGSAVLELRTDDAKFTKGVKGALVGAKKLDRGLVKAKRSAGKLGKTLGGLGKRVGNLGKSFVSMRGAAVLAAGVIGLGLLIKKSLDTADAIGKAADAIGISTDALQEYRFAAEIAGVSTAVLDKSLLKATKNIGELARSSSELDLTLTDLDATLLADVRAANSVEEAIDLVFVAMASYEKQTKRAAVANAFFGRSGILLTNIVRDGVDAFRLIIAEARTFGLIIPESIIRNAEEANDQLLRMARVISTQTTIALASLAPIIIEIGNAFLENIPKIKSFTENIMLTFGVFEGVSLDKLRQELVETKEELAAADRVWVAVLETALDFVTEPILGLETFSERIARLKARIEALTMTIDAATVAAAGLNEESETLAITIQPARFKPVSEEEFNAAIKKREELEKRAQRVIAQTRTAQEQFNMTMVNLGELLSLRKIDWETYRRAVEEAQKELQEANEEGTNTFDALERAGESAFDNLTDALLDFTETGKLEWRSLAQVAIAALQDILSASIKSGLSGLIGDLFGGPGVTTGTLSPLRPPPGPLRLEHGGRLSSGRLALVGEAGPELFMPDTSGTVISNRDLVGSNRGDTFFIDARGADQAGIQRLERIITSLNGSIERRSVAAVREASMRSPAFFRAGR